MAKRVFVLGLDCLAPRLVFEQFRTQLPHFRRLMEQGSWGLLRSVHPPITVPAWACATSGYDAGQLGLYGFRNRAGHGYEQLSLALATQVQRPRLWEHLDGRELRCLVLGVPPLFPVPRLAHGAALGCFLTPEGEQTRWSEPPGFGAELQRALGTAWTFDVAPFRTEKRGELLQRIYRMTQQHFDAVCHLLRQPDWHLLFLVHMGPDRLHHAFWQFFDPEHPQYPGRDNPWAAAVPEYYQFLDRQLGRVLDALPPDVLLLVVSDHGARPLEGGIAVNQWLLERGYLVLKHRPEQPTPWAKVQVDWPRTAAWSEGGYYARVFLNVQGREPQGMIPPAEYEAWRTRLAGELEALPGPDGEPVPTVVFRPEELFQQCRGVAPDLICYWGNLRFRSVGTVGGSIHWQGNDTGPDGANHDWDGVFLSSRPLQQGVGEVTGLQLLDLGPSLLAYFGLPVPEDAAGKPCWQWQE